VLDGVLAAVVVVTVTAVTASGTVAACLDAPAQPAATSTTANATNGRGR
jgi:hypothetical protein